MNGIIKYLKISDSEWPRARAMCALSFLLMLGWGIGAAGRNSFFIKEIGPDMLPHLYIFNAIVLVIISNIYSRIVDRTSLYKLFIGLLVVFGSSLLALRLVIPSKFYWLPFAVFFLSELVVQVIILMHYWTLANHVFNPREGKRIFPILGGAGLAGVIAGGVFTALIVEMIGTANLFLLWGILLFTTIPCVYWVKFTAKSSTPDTKSLEYEPNGDQAKNKTEGLKDILEIPLVRSLAYIAIPMWVVVNFIDYQFFQTMNEVIQDQDRLTRVFGLLGSIFSIGGLLFQLFITSRLLHRFGVGAMILAHPISMFIGSLGLGLRSVFTPLPSQSMFSFRSLSAIFASFSDEGIGTSTGESANQLVFNAISRDKRGRSRAFIVGTVEPICSILSGILLLVLLRFEVTELCLSSLIITCSAIWIWLGFKVESDYLHALVDNVGSGSVELQIASMNQLSDINDRNSLQILVDGLLNMHEEVALFALEMLKQSEEDNLSEHLCKVLPHVSDGVKIAILSALGDCWNRSAISVVRPFIDSGNAGVQAAAIKTIGRVGTFDDIKFLERFIDNSDVEIRSQTIIALMKWNRMNEQKVLEPKKMLLGLARHPQSFLRMKAAYIVGEIGSKDLTPILLELSNTDDDSIIYAVIDAISKINDEAAVPVLIGLLRTERYTRQVIDAIYGLGNLALESLHNLLFSGETNENTQKPVLICLGKISNPASIVAISDFLTKESPSISCEQIGVTVLNVIKQNNLKNANFNKIFSDASSRISKKLKQVSTRIRTYHHYLESLQSIKDQNAVVLLVDALEKFTKMYEEIAFSYLEFVGDPLSTKSAAFNLRSTNYRVRSEALEILDASSKEAKDLVHVLEPIYLQLKEKKSRIKANELFTEFLGESYPEWLRVCAIYSIGELKLTMLCDTLRNYYKSTKDRLTNPLIKNHVLCALTKIGSGNIRGFDPEEIEALDRDMKKIQFLRGVNLFAEIDGSDLRWISSISKQIVYKKGEILFQEEDREESIGLIQTGSVCVVSEKNSRSTYSTLKERDCFGELSLFDDEPKWDATGEALEKTEVLIINLQDFLELLLARPQLSLALIKTVVSKLRAALAEIAEVGK